MPFRSQTEYISVRLIGRLDRKLPEQGFVLLSGVIKALVWDLKCCAMHLMVIVAAHFVMQYFTRAVDLVDMFPCTCPDQPVLEPAIGPFDLALCFRGECVNDFHIAVMLDLLPLRCYIVCEQSVLSPYAEQI